MSTPLAIVLIVGAGVWIAMLAGAKAYQRGVRDVERKETAAWLAQSRLEAYQRRYMCAVRGHKYMCYRDGWHCPVCGDTCPLGNDDGAA